MTTYNPNNIFAKIIRGEIPSKLIYEDDYTFSIHDINPLAKIHALAICKKPFITFTDFISKGSEKDILGFSNGIQKTIEILELVEPGYRLITNAGHDGRQEVPQLHIHILGGQELIMPEKSI